MVSQLVQEAADAMKEAARVITQLTMERDNAVAALAIEMDYRKAAEAALREPDADDATGQGGR